MAVIKGRDNKSVVKDMEKLEPSHTINRIFNGAATLENSLAVHHKVKYRIVL